MVSGLVRLLGTSKAMLLVLVLLAAGAAVAVTLLQLLLLLDQGLEDLVLPALGEVLQPAQDLGQVAALRQLANVFLGQLE